MKVRAIFRWICGNIRFHTEAFWEEKPTAVEPKDVIKNRMTVAKGYANLFATLCKKANLQVLHFFFFISFMLTLLTRQR